MKAIKLVTLLATALVLGSCGQQQGGQSSSSAPAPTSEPTSTEPAYDYSTWIVEGTTASEQSYLAAITTLFQKYDYRGGLKVPGFAKLTGYLGQTEKPSVTDKTGYSYVMFAVATSDHAAAFAEYKAAAITAGGSDAGLMLDEYLAYAQAGYLDGEDFTYTTDEAAKAYILENYLWSEDDCYIECASDSDEGPAAYMTIAHNEALFGSTGGIQVYVYCEAAA